MTFKITYESIRTEVSSYIYIYILHMTLYILYTSYKNLLRALLAVSCHVFSWAKRSNVLNVHASVVKSDCTRVYIINMIFMIGIMIA